MLPSGVPIWLRRTSALAAAGLILAGAAAGQGRRLVQPQKLAPYVSSPQPIVIKMLEIAGLKSGQTLYDLGCGDGRIVATAAKEFGAKAVGVELSPALAKKARQAVESLGLQEQVKIIEGDMMEVDLSGADVVALLTGCVYCQYPGTLSCRPSPKTTFRSSSPAIRPGWRGRERARSSCL